MQLRRITAAALVATVVTACGGDVAAPATPTAASAADAATREIRIYRSPDCSCCHEWAALLSKAGWEVGTADLDDMAAFKQQWGVPDDAASCHTAFVAGYVVEGHVPLAAIEQLLAERPAIDGIALPGMPPGSPGMGGQKGAPFEVVTLVDGQVGDAFGSY